MKLYRRALSESNLQILKISSASQRNKPPKC